MPIFNGRFWQYRTPKGYLLIAEQPQTVWDLIAADYDLDEMVAEHHAQ